MSFLQGASHVAILGGTQVAVAAGSNVTINQGTRGGSSSAFKDLSAAAAHTALHDSAARFGAPRCHRSTRAQYRDQLEKWMRGEGEKFEGKQLIWLHGGAGAGKSAIVQSVVEECAQHGVILGTFFFSRTDSTRNTAEVLIPTLAYQVAQAFPEAMVILDPILQRNPLIFKASLHTQAVELLVRPLRYLIQNGIMDCTTSLRRVFVVDGLDECNDPQKQALIIQVIASMLCDHHVPVSFLIASRPELAISSAFEREKKLHSRFTIITLENDDNAESDIRQFIEDSFLDILDTHPWRVNIELPWPDPHHIDLLVWKSSGHFIYAATAMRYIASSDEHPGRALRVVQGLEPSRTGSPFSELDALYMHILTSARYSKQVLEILRHCYMSSFFSSSVASVCFVHYITPQDVSLFLSDVRSLVALVPDDKGELHVSSKHASLGEFVGDEARSQGLHVGSRDYHASFLAQYFQLLDDGPHKLTDSLDLERGSDDVKGFLRSLSFALECSRDTGLLQPLVACHSPYDIWNFWAELLVPNRRSAIQSVSDYICALRDSVALHDDTLYSRQVKMYMELVLDDINDLAHKIPQYRIIPALVFSSGLADLPLVCDLMRWDVIGGFDLSYIFYPLRKDKSSKKIDPRAYEAIKQMPQSRLSWSADLAIAMMLLLQQLMLHSGPGPSILHSSPHRQWLRRHKGLKHTALGLPRMSSAVSHHLTEIQTGIDGAEVYDAKYSNPFLYSCWRRLLPLYLDKLGDQRRKYRALLKAVTFYLRKADCINEVVILARKSLPMAALWHPKLMKRARAEMDAYVRRWEVTRRLVGNDQITSYQRRRLRPTDVHVRTR